LDAVGQARERCWRNDWVLDLDIKGFFDNLEPNLSFIDKAILLPSSVEQQGC